MVGVTVIGVDVFLVTVSGLGIWESVEEVIAVELETDAVVSKF